MSSSLMMSLPKYSAKYMFNFCNRQDDSPWCIWYIPANRPHLRDVLERLKMGKVSRLLLSRTAMAEGKEYFPSKEREQNEDFRNREMQKRDERTNALRPKKEKVKNRWRDDGYEGRSFNEGREPQREPREFQFREERFRESRGFGENRFEREGERQERRGFHSERRFESVVHLQSK